jgi:hypothetical protein
MESNELLERAAFGKQVELFWGSAIGQYLQNRARDQYTAAVQELKTVDPTDWRAVAKLQQSMVIAENFESWLSEAVIDGAKALELLEDENADS